MARYSQAQLRKGIKVEHEHTDDPRIARQIALDHLIKEHPRYYDYLEIMEEIMAEDLRRHQKR